jgi:hypothetical protein
MQQVIVTIENGVPKVEVKCVKGASCKTLTRDLERALGSVSKTEQTKEFHEHEQKHQAAH